MGIGRLRLPQWNPYAHIELYLVRGPQVGPGLWGEAPSGEGAIHSGPWVRLYDPCAMLALNREWNAYDDLLIFQMEDAHYEAWEPPADYARFETAPKLADAKPTIH